MSGAPGFVQGLMEDAEPAREAGRACSEDNFHA